MGPVTNDLRVVGSTSGNSEVEGESDRTDHFMTYNCYNDVDHCSSRLLRHRVNRFLVSVHDRVLFIVENCKLFFYIIQEKLR